jgi:hypothetical protein
MADHGTGETGRAKRAIAHAVPTKRASWPSLISTNRLQSFTRRFPGKKMLPLLVLTLMAPIHAAALPGFATATAELRQPDLRETIRPSRDRVAEAAPRRRLERQPRRQQARPAFSAKGLRAPNCHPADRRCEVERKLGGVINDMPFRGMPPWRQFVPGRPRR